MPPAPPRLEVAHQVVVLSPGAELTGAHLRRDRDRDARLAVVEAHPTEAGQLVLHNLSLESWTVEPEGEAAKRVAPGQRLRVRPLAIDLGGVRGTIRLG